MVFGLTSFENTLQRFAEALQVYQNAPRNSIVRDACIHRFKFCYELSHKTLNRYLEVTSASPTEIDQLAFANLIRTANEQGLLLHDWPYWKRYRAARNITSQIYDEDKAMEVVAILPDFLIDAQALLQKLKNRRSP